MGFCCKERQVACCWLFSLFLSLRDREVHCHGLRTTWSPCHPRLSQRSPGDGSTEGNPGENGKLWRPPASGGPVFSGLCQGVCSKDCWGGESSAHPCQQCWCIRWHMQKWNHLFHSCIVKVHNTEIIQSVIAHPPHRNSTITRIYWKVASARIPPAHCGRVYYRALVHFAHLLWVLSAFTLTEPAEFSALKVPGWRTTNGEKKEV